MTRHTQKTPAIQHRALSSLAAVFLGSTLSGCASTMDPLAIEQAEYERKDAEIVLAEKFHARVNRCRLSGGYMVLPMGGGGRIDRSTMEKAYCDKNWRGLKGVIYD